MGDTHSELTIESYRDHVTEKPIPSESFDNLQWEDCACSWCASVESNVMFSGPDYLHGLPGIFQMVQCTQCGLIRQNPRLQWESLQGYYPDDYQAYARLAREETNPLRRLNRLYGSKKRLRAIHRYIPGGKLLDVGFGSGLFLEVAFDSKQWEVEGIEPTKHAYDYVKRSLPVTVFHGLFTEVNLEPSQFDLITMWNVLEHMPDPIMSIRNSNRLLVDGGWLVFSLPNPDSLIQRIFGRFWVGWDLPRHLYIFPLNTLNSILNELGFELVSTKCLSTSYAMLGHSIEFWSQTWGDQHPWLKCALLRGYYSVPTRVALLLPLWIMDRLRQSTVITVFARKIHQIGE